MATPSLVILLVEDSRQQQFAFRYLRRVGLGPHAIRVRVSPAGTGSAEQWVRAQFPMEVAACRGRQAATKLIVLVDADTQSVQEPIEQLVLALRAAGSNLVDEHVQYALRLIPKRNIETWTLCLNGEEVDEETNYKGSHRDWTDLIRPAVEVLYNWTRPNASVPASCVASLQSGIGELGKLGV